MSQLHLLCGTNLGNRLRYLQQAQQLVEEQVGQIIKASSIYETAAWGITQQPSFLNQVLILDTNRAPSDVLGAILQIEKDMGRIRYKKWGERAIDIDILFFEGVVMESPELTIPHPWLQDRRFTLAPLVEIDPDLMHPIFQLTATQLLEQCKDTLMVTKIATVPDAL